MEYVVVVIFMFGCVAVFVVIGVVLVLLVVVTCSVWV